MKKFTENYTYKESDKMIKVPKDCKPENKNLPDKQRVRDYYRNKK